MPDKKRTVQPGPRPKTVRTTAGEVLTPPNDWALLPPGDAAVTKKVKAAGPSWTVQTKRGRRTFSQGVWASAKIIEEVQKAVKNQRETPEYAKKRASDLLRRDKKQSDYVDEFFHEVVCYLDFAPKYEHYSNLLGKVIAEHATPVGSGTVARTKRISIDRRAEAAVIAWMRHQTTAYDKMVIPRVKGMRREVRARMARKSRAILEAYRTGGKIEKSCPLRVFLDLNLSNKKIN